MKDKIEFYTIRGLRQENKTDEEIKKQLGISTNKLERYKEQLQEYESNKLEGVMDDLAYEYTDYINDLHEEIKLCKEASKSGTSLEKMEAGRMKLFCHTELIRVMESAPSIIAKLQVAPTLKKAFKDMSKNAVEVKVDVRDAGEKKDRDRS